MTEATDAEVYSRDGYLVIRGFYDVERDVEPIRRDIRNLVELVAAKHGVTVPCATPEEAMTVGYRALVDRDRTWASEVYDAIKQIPAYLRLVAHPKNEALIHAMQPNALPGLATQSYGIRIDNPGEEKFRSMWHQEFPGQLRSLDGVVFWSPLLPVTREMGPVELCVGSSRGGLVRTVIDGGDVGRYGAYSLKLVDEAAHVARYDKAAPLTEPGDLLIMNFLTLHQSGHNRADRPRWSMQFRYFNYRDATGQKINWTGSYTAGVDPTIMLDELYAELSA